MTIDFLTMKDILSNLILLLIALIGVKLALTMKLGLGDNRTPELGMSSVSGSGLSKPVGDGNESGEVGGRQNK